MRRFLFLDIDGVIAITFGQFLSDKHCEFDPIPVNNLNLLCERFPDLEIIISSSWRFSENVESMKLIFLMRGFKYPKQIIGFTPKLRLSEKNSYSLPRGVEIDFWIRENTQFSDQYKYVILDDDSDMLLWQKDNFLKTDGEEGFTKDLLYRAEEILKE
jgi:hypothetical protein